MFHVSSLTTKYVTSPSLTASPCAHLGYFRGQEVLNKPEVIVPIYERTVPVADEPSALTYPKTPVPSAKASSGLPPIKALSSKLLFKFPLSLLLVSGLAGLLYVGYPTFAAVLSLSPRVVAPH